MEQESARFNLFRIPLLFSRRERHAADDLIARNLVCQPRDDPIPRVDFSADAPDIEVPEQRLIEILFDITSIWTSSTPFSLRCSILPSRSLLLSNVSILPMDSASSICVLLKHPILVVHYPCRKRLNRGGGKGNQHHDFLISFHLIYNWINIHCMYSNKEPEKG